MSKIQNEDIKSESELIAQGGAKTQLPNDTKIYVSHTAVAETLDDAIETNKLHTLKELASIPTPPSGYQRISPKTDGFWYSKNSAGEEKLLGSGSGGDFDFLALKKLADYTLYDDGDVAVPVDGTGDAGGAGDNQLSIAVSPSPIDSTAGVLNLRIAKAAPSARGEGVGVAFTTRGDIDKSAVRVCKVAIKSSANFADNDAGIYLYDVTNSRIIYAADQNIKASSFVSNQQFEFQLSPDSTSYRLIMHVQSTNATAYDLDFVVKVVETKTATGPIVTDWISYTPTFAATGGGAAIGNGTISGFWRRVGGDAEIKLSAAFGSTTTFGSGDFTFSMPSGLSIDSGKIIGYMEGMAFMRDATTSANYQLGNVRISSFFDKVRVAASATNSEITPTIPFTWATSDTIFLSFKAPIVGWSSNQVLSEDVSSRDISFLARMVGNQTVTTGSNQTIVGGTSFNADFDPTASYANGIFTAPESGKYRFDAIVNYSMGATPTGEFRLMFAYNDTSTMYYFADETNNTANRTETQSGSIVLKLNKGDTVRLKAYSSGQNVILNAGWVYFSGSRIASPQQIASSAKTFAFYTSNAGQSVPDSTATALIFEDKVTDSDNAYNVSTGVYTCPRSGLLRMAVQYLYNATTTWEASESLQTDVRVNGTAIKRDLWYQTNAVTNNINMGTKLFITGYPVIKGDQIDVLATQNSDGALSIISNSIYNNIGIIIE